MHDAEKVREMFPQIPVCCVPGNCDGYYDDEEAYKLITLGRSRHFSHTATAMPCAAASSMWLLYAAECCGAQIAMFGHTHRALSTRSAAFVLNPGTAGKAPRRTWAKLEITPDGTVSCDICDIVS